MEKPTGYQTSELPVHAGGEGFVANEDSEFNIAELSGLCVIGRRDEHPFQVRNDAL